MNRISHLVGITAAFAFMGCNQPGSSQEVSVPPGVAVGAKVIMEGVETARLAEWCQSRSCSITEVRGGWVKCASAAPATAFGRSGEVAAHWVNLSRVPSVTVCP